MGVSSVFAGPDLLRPQPLPVPQITTAQSPRPGAEQLPVRTELPDPLVTPDGRHITNATDWEKQRVEVEALLMFYATGLVPPSPGNVIGRVIADRVLLDGGVRYRLVRLNFGPEQKVGFDFALSTPVRRTGPFPTVVPGCD
jgi:hypothetical protein